MTFPTNVGGAGRIIMPDGFSYHTGRASSSINKGLLGGGYRFLPLVAAQTYRRDFIQIILIMLFPC